MGKKTDLNDLQRALGYEFKDPAILRLALTHTSYSNEHKKSDPGNNERLEFLGDAVVDLVAAAHLAALYPCEKEGDLSRRRAAMVSEKPLARCARHLGIPPHLLLGNGEESTGGRDRDSILSDAMEAVIGAIFTDGGFDAAFPVVRDHILNDLSDDELFDDRRSPLQEYYQDMGKKVEWELISEEGPPHDRTFRVAAVVSGEVVGEGEGRTKKAAAQNAAGDAIKRLNLRIK